MVKKVQCYSPFKASICAVNGNNTLTGLVPHLVVDTVGVLYYIFAAVDIQSNV